MNRGLFDLTGRVVLVTGATGGLGRAIVQRCAEHGAQVAASDVDGRQCTDLAESLRRLGYDVAGFGADLAELDGIDRLIHEVQARFGRVDVLVCNAGIAGPSGPLHAVEQTAWDRVFNINLRSAQRLCAQLTPGMAARSFGRIVLMASIAALRGNRSIGLYGMSKAALAQLARNLAVEWGAQGITANAIAPGLIRTPLSEGLMHDAQFMQRRLAATPLRRVGEPDEVAGVVVMLAGAAGGFMTGQTLVVDGGTVISDGS